MLMEKKLKLLILDDLPDSIKTVIKCVLRSHPDIYEEELVEQAESLLDIACCETVSEAKERFGKFKPDFVFVDLKIENNKEPDAAIRKNPFQGLELIKWIRERQPADFPVKVHSQYLSDYEVLNELDKHSIPHLGSFKIENYCIQPELLARCLPELLRELAKARIKALGQNAEAKSSIRMQLTDAYKRKDWHQALKSLGGYSLASILVGWLYLDLEDGESIRLELTAPFMEIMEDLFSPTSKAKLPANIVETMRSHTRYPVFSEIARQHAEEVVHAFLDRWRNVTVADLQATNYPAPLQHQLLETAKNHIGRINKQAHSDQDEDDVHIHTFAMRLIVGGVYELREQLQPCVREKVLDCAVLACLRNAPGEFLKQASKSQVKKYLSILSLGKLRQNKNPVQHLDTSDFYDDEKEWLKSIGKIVLK